MKAFLRRVLGLGETRSAGNTGYLIGPRVIAGVEVTAKSALTFGAVFAAVNAISTDCAAMPLNLYRQLEGGGAEPDLNDPLHDVLHHTPDGLCTSFKFRQTLIADALLWGAGYAEIERYTRSGQVAALHRMSPRPADTRPERRGKEIVYILEAENRELPASKVLHISGFGPDEISGYSVVSQARQGIGLGLALEAYGASLFGNSSVPKGILRTAKRLNDDVIARLRQSWDRVHQGVENGNKIAILEEGLEWVATGMSAEDAQFLATRQFQILEIARWFRVPPHKLMDFSQAHLANLEESNLDYLISTLIPWLIVIEQQMCLKLLTREQRKHSFIEHDATAILRGNMQARANFYKTMTDGGLMSRDEVRRRERLNPIPGGGGRKFTVQMNLTTLDQVGEKVA